MRAARTEHRRAFTLLEAIVAIVILSAVALVCLQLRVQSAAQMQRLREHQETDQALSTLLEMAEADLLPDPQGPDDDDPEQTVRWRGEHLGDPYTCTRRRETIANPVAGASSRDVPPTIAIRRYVVSYRGREATVLRPPRINRRDTIVIEREGAGS